MRFSAGVSAGAVYGRPGGGLYPARAGSAEFIAAPRLVPPRGAGGDRAAAVRERVFIYIKTNILPRQARDRHRENSKQSGVLCRGSQPWTRALAPVRKTHLFCDAM